MSFAHQIEIFSIHALPIQTDGIAVNVCWLDNIERIEAQLSEVSQDISEIKKQIKEQEGALIKAMDCQYQASLYGIQKLPAIVIDKEYVAYGVVSVAKALEALKDKAEYHV